MAGRQGLADPRRAWARWATQLGCGPGLPTGAEQATPGWFSLAGITLPIWYWAPWQEVHGVRYHGYPIGYFPNGPHGHPGYGLYVDTLPKALLAAAVFLILFLLFNYVLVATARVHATVARALLHAPEDPLREAKEVLSRPGPLSEFNLGEFIPNGP